MRILLFLTTLYTALVIYGVAVAAKEGEEPIALQTSNWTIQSFDGLQNVNIAPDQCTMRADYDTGMRLILKATGERLTALRIQTTDTSNNILTVKGFVGLGVGKNSYALQSRHENGQIDATLVTVPNLADKLTKATVLRLKLGVKNHYFALQGFADGYHRLMVCMGIQKTKTLKVVNEESTVPGIPSVRMEPAPRAPVLTEMPSEPVEVVKAQALEAPKPETAPVEVTADDQPQVIVTAETQQDIEPQTETAVKEDTVKPAALPKWRAKKGQKLSTVLKNWASIEGVKTHIVLDRDPILSKDIISNGSFAMAVNVVLQETGMGRTGPSAIVKNADGRVTHVAGYQGGAMTRTQGRAISDSNRWRALEGTDLRKVLKRWSVRNNVDFKWDAPETFLIRQSMKATVKYDQAVTLLLSQFEGQPTRPVAQLNIDPNTGQKSLTVKTSRTSG